MFEVEQAGHQASGELGSSGVAATCARQCFGSAKHVLVFEDLAGSILTLELRRYRCFDLAPWQPSCQHGQGIVQIDHGVNSAAEKV